MAIPLSFLRSTPGREDLSLGDILSNAITCSDITTLLGCIPSTSSAPAIYSPDVSPPPLRYDVLHSFITNFSLPHSSSRRPLGPNDRVMIVLPTGPENALALLSIACYHTCAPVNASCTAPELKEDAHRLRARAIVATRDVQERLDLQSLAQELDCDVIFVEKRFSGQAGLFDMTLMDESVQLTSPPSKLHGLDDQSLILHTSGTSGKKKVVPYTLRSLIVGTCAVIQSWDLQPSDINMNMMPLFHVGGIVRNLLAPILSGGSAIMCSGFDAITFWRLARELEATWYYAAPTIHHAILTSQPEDIDPSRDMHIRMICNAAGGLLPSLAVDLKERFGGAVVLPSYGMTECMPITTPPTTYQLERPGCSGIPCGPYLSIRNTANLEQALPSGSTGAICVRGLPTFQGYEVSPDISVPLDTSAFTSEGWFDSGDCGYLDDDGYLYVTGRSKEIINKGGEVISPFEVEEAIITVARDYVKTTLAFAIDHDVLQEAIGVVIVPVAGRPRLGLAQLHELLRGYLHPSKWPFAIVYMQDLPKNSAGKHLRIKLSARLGLGTVTDDFPPIRRHYEAEVPDPMASLSDPIKCSQVTVDAAAVETVLKTASGVSEVAVRLRDDGSTEAFVSGTDLSLTALKVFLTQSLSGYAIPEPLHVLSSRLMRTKSGVIDFIAMEKEVGWLNNASLSPEALCVRDIVANVLLIDAITITGDSDFFLLGGNSLLLGKLCHQIRKQTNVNVPIVSVFTNSTINGIASLIQKDNRKADARLSVVNSTNSSVTLNEYYAGAVREHSRGQHHPISLIVQAIPFIFFYPLKAAVTWTMLLLVLSYLAQMLDEDYWARMVALLCAIFVARLTSRIICPITAILFKWIVIGKYKPGKYRMWSNYHLRWWIVDQSLRSAGRGIFAMNPTLQKLYFRLLGAHIGKDVHIHSSAKLGEHDLLTIEDGSRIDSSVIRGFCVEQNGYFTLDTVVIGRNAVINTYTRIAPGGVIAPGAVYGPHSSSLENPSPPGHAACNRTLFAQPHWTLKFFIAWPIIILVRFVSYIPWFACLWLMIKDTIVITDGMNALEATIYWFASPQRVAFHALSRVVRALATPLLHLILAIIVKRVFGLNKPSPALRYSQLSLLRRYINSILLSKHKLATAFSLLGTHYEVVSHVYRAMGAKIGRHVYWPGSGIFCEDPELLEIGDHVVFGSRSELFTTDGLGTDYIRIGDGAMIADRVVLLPGTHIERQCMMGSGALGKRDGFYPIGSTWMGNDSGEAVCLNKGKDTLTADTTTPFGRAFYQREASYFVFPYILVLAIHLIVAACSAAYWSIPAISSAQLLRQCHIHFKSLHLFDSRWYRFGTLYGLIASFFVVILNFQAIATLFWVIVTKWIVIGRRKAGNYTWDKSDYCQRWQLHLILSRPMFKRFGNDGILACLTGTAYIVWFLRAEGAKIGKNCAVWAGGKVGLMTEPDLVEIGDDVSLDACSVVAHINSRGQFALNPLKIGHGCAMRNGSRLLSGASMEDGSMLCEHTLLTSGEIADSGSVYVGWPGKRVESFGKSQMSLVSQHNSSVCSICHRLLKDSTVTPCGHLFCANCIIDAVNSQGLCPPCSAPTKPHDLVRVDTIVV